MVYCFRFRRKINKQNFHSSYYTHFVVVVLVFFHIQIDLIVTEDPNTMSTGSLSLKAVTQNMSVIIKI